MAGPVPRRIWVDGRLVPWEEATLHLLAHSVQRGSLIFDYLSVHETTRGTALFRLPEHLERFQRSLALVGLSPEISRDAIARGVLETVRANPGARAVKICAYLPSVEVDVVPVDDRVSVAIAAYDPVADVLDRKPSRPERPQALRVHLERERSKVPGAAIPAEAKVAAHYLGPMIAKWRAVRAGFDEVLLVDARGELAEGPTTNVFLVDGEGALETPATGAILQGVTRRTILEIAKHDGLSVRERRLLPESLFDAAEVFVTGTTAGVWPVVRVDDHPVGTGEPGPVTRHLRARLAAVSGGEDPAFLHWLTWIDEA